MEGKRRGRIFWIAVVVYALWLTAAVSHSIGKNKPVGSFLVVSIIPLVVVVLLWRQSEKRRSKKP